MSHSQNCGQCGFSSEPENSRCVLTIHSCPRTLISHVEWAVASGLGRSARFQWEEQSFEPGSYRVELDFVASAGTVGRLVSDLRTFPGVRFEASQEATSSSTAERFCFTPSLGIYRGEINSIGETLVTESRIRAVMTRNASPVASINEIEQLFGSAWDQELEPYRVATFGTCDVRWVHEVV